MVAAVRDPGYACAHADAHAALHALLAPTPRPDPYNRWRRPELVDTHSREVGRLSPSAASALKNAHTHTLTPPASESEIQALVEGEREEQIKSMTADQPMRALYGTESSKDPSKPLNASEMLFRIEHHGYQCLVYSSLARTHTLGPPAEEVSWVTQLTVDRLKMLPKMLSRWRGPVSVALYSQNLAADVLEIEELRDRVDFHIVGASQGMYPVNTLRNVAMDNARAAYVVIADADFVPSDGMYEYIKAQLPEMRQKGKSVFVLPAFQIDGADPEAAIPLTKEELRAMGEGIHQVHNDASRTIAHANTDYTRWMGASEMYKAQYKFPYEPYFLAPKTIPKFDPRFYGYGNDKASHCYELNAAGWSFEILPEAFVVHVTHPQGSWVQQTFMDPKERVARTLTTFLVDVDRRYGTRKFADDVTHFPPLDERLGFETVVGRLGESCEVACADRGKVCRKEWSERVNECGVLEKHLTCVQGCNDGFYGSDLPAHNTQRDQCLINNSPKTVAFNCAVTYQFSRRLCPCGVKL
eukprot:CAMPEP_0206225024 /NCGR_PEP_ID=MMETSP0047_2-20121206/7334_1 /ASSEMBLY_ACC=CAM_ASM_000192 /TAXON_ID=195065 /ORGANISM="Chroomonas mesostigmatica_cf, Strain CCMP1168" /LENGTH=525 /DNA_ID=CAMNT_0053648011 /DNA_START=438 /DNA_END=2013 /DNA_ORIENTATION=-